MDFLKGIGDFFSGWFGGKKRKRIQDEMSVVSEQAYQHAKQATPEQAQPQIAPTQPATAQIQAPTPQEQSKPTDLSEANQQARQLVHRPMSDQARFNQMRRGGMGHAEAQAKIQAEKDAINRRIQQRQAEERQKHEQEVKQPMLNEIEKTRQAINSAPNISQRQKDAVNQRADELEKKINYVANLNNVEYKDWWAKDYERFANLNQRINEAYSLGKSIFDKTGDANKARQAIDQQLAHSDEMTRLEDEEKGYRDTAGAIALATQIPRDVVKTVGRYGTKLTTSGLEALGNMTNNQALANAARQGQQALDEAVFNKLDTEYDNRLIKGLTGGVTDLGMDLVTGKAVVGALGKAGALNKVVKGADKANQFLSKQGKLSSLVGKGIQAGLGSPEAIASTATALFRHYPQNYNEVYNDARAKGVDHHQANILAHSNAVVNAGIEKMNLDLSGWFKVSGATPNRGFQAIKRAVGEGAEEWTQTMSTYAVKSIYSNIDWNKAISEANESGLMGVVVGGIADQINAHLPKVLHKIDQEVDHKINPALQPITNALVKVELKKQITKAVQPDSQILTEAMRLNDEAVKFKLASDEQAGQLQPAYDPVNRQLISYDQQDMAKLQQLHQQYGNDFTEHLNQTQEVIYNHLLDQATRDQQGRYQDPITGETWIDEVVDYNGKKAVKTEYQAEDINNRQRIRDDILAKFGGQEISLNEINQEAGVTKKSAGKLAGKSYSKQPLDHVNAKVNSAMHIDELGLTMTNVQIENNSKNTQKNAPTYIKGDTIIIDNGRAYEASLVVKHYPDGKNTVYDVVIQKEIVAPHTPMRDNAPESPVPHLGSPSEQQWVNSDASSVNIAQSDENVNLNSAYDPINNQLISYDQQDINQLHQLHQQYGNDFTEHLNQTQEVIYNHLLDQATRDQQGRYQDPITGETWIDEVISRDDGSQYVRVDNKIVNDYDDNSLIRQKIKQTIAEKFQGNQYQVGDTDILARVTGKTKNELSYKQRYMNDGDYRHKANMAGNLDEILNTMTDVRIVPNKKVTQKPYVDHYISGRTEVEIDGHLYYPRVDIEVSKNGQIIAYDIADIRSIKKEPRAEADNRSYMRETNSALDNQGSVSDGNIAQSPEKVNPVEYNDLHEAEYQPDQASGSVLDRRQRFDATATEVDGQVQASERAWRDNRGTEVGTNDEVAREKIAQLLKDYRNPDRELTHFFYVKDGVIVGHNVTTLNDPILSSVGAKEAMWGINNRMERLGADKFYLAHNHPSGNLSASSGDRHVTQIIQKQLGDKFGGHIITDHDGILTSKDGYFDKTNIDLGEQYVKDGVQITTEDKALELAKEHFDPKVNHDKIGLFMLDVLYRPIGYEKFRPRMKDGKVDIEATNNTIKQMAAKHNGIVTLVAAGDDFKHIDNRTGIQGIIGDQLMLPTDSGDFRSLNNFEGGDTKAQSARLRKYLARNGKNNFLHDGASDIKQELSQDPTPIKQVIDQKQDEFKNVPLENKNHAYTKGNLYEQTTIGSSDDVIRGGGAENGRRFIFGSWEMRQHTRKKNGKSFTQVERRYIDPETGEAGDWKPYSRAAYLWHTQSDKIDQANRDQLIQQALEAAKQDGEVREFVATTDEKTGGTKVQPLTGNKTIDGGLVRDPISGEVEGNYIQVTPFGVVNQVAGKLHLTELDQIIAKNSDKKAKPGIFDTYMRTVEKTAANEQSKQTQQDLYYKKTMAYAEFIKNKEEVLAGHTEQAGILEGYRPKGVKAKHFWEDVGRYTENTFPALEGKNQQEAFAQKYGQEAAQAVEKYSQYMRQQYDSLINQANTVRRMYGKDEIPHRKNYMPHMTKDGGLLGMMPAEIAANLRGEMETVGRGEIPANIAGLSETFKPNKKYNQHEMRRKRQDASDYELDPRKVFEKYADLVLYNAHMEPVIAEGRQLETAMRVADHVLAKEVLDPLSALKQSEAKVSSRQTIAIMDFVNAMAGKSNALDRAFIDRTANQMRILRKLENINGANKIMGNISSTFAQALNLPSTVRENGLINTTKALLFGARKPEVKIAMKRSPFLTERYGDGGDKFSKTNWQKISGGVSKVSGMDAVESAFIRLAWGANYQRFKSEGHKGFELIKRADQATERAVGGRGIGAMPQAYQSALGKIFLQFTYETNETFKNDIEHVAGIVGGIKSGEYGKSAKMALHSAEAMVLVMLMNFLWKMGTGNEPLPDPATATIKSIGNLMKSNEDKTKDKNIIKNIVGNVGTEFIKSNPVASAAVNMLPKSDRQQVFGSDSDFGRFDGATGVAQTAASGLKGVMNLASGEHDKAAQNLTQIIPMGSQIRKTVGGADALLKGAVTKKDKNGDEQVVYEVNNTDPVNIVKGLVFGKNALNETQAHYQAKDGQVSKSSAAETNQQSQNKLLKQQMGDDYKIYKMNQADRKKAVIEGKISKQRFDEVDQKARSIKQKLGMEVKELDKYQAAVNKLKLERDYLDKAGYEQAEDQASLNQQLELAEFKLKLSKNESDRPILEAYDRMSAQGFKRFTKNDLRRFAQRQANPQEFWGKLLNLDQQQYQITGKYKLHNKDGEADTIEQTARGRGRRKSGKINFNSGVDFSAISTKARSIGQSIKSPARGAVSYQISNNAFTYQPMPIRRSTPRLPKYSKKR